jgi:aspartate racemase
VLGILANTMHLVYDDVVRGSGLPVIHVVDTVAEAAERAGFTTVALLGTRYTMSSRELYPPRLAVRGITTLVPAADDAAEVNRIVYEELVRGVVLDSSRATLRAIVDRLVEQGAQAVVLGCTELAMLLDPDGTDAPVPLLDSTSLHVDALLEASLSSSAEAEPLEPPALEAVSLEEGAA